MVASAYRSEVIFEISDEVAVPEKEIQAATWSLGAARAMRSVKGLVLGHGSGGGHEGAVAGGVLLVFRVSSQIQVLSAHLNALLYPVSATERPTARATHS
jgi:hypothetical protein